MAPTEQSPYSAISAMAIDPIYVDVAAVPEFAAAGGERSLSRDDGAVLERVRQSPTVQYAAIRSLKERALRAAFERFVDAEVRKDSERARAFARFLTEQAWWIDEYAIFRAIHFSEGERPWTAWPEPLRRRDRPALADARFALETDVMFRQYVQWIAHTQWAAARAATGTAWRSSATCRSWWTATARTSGRGRISFISTSRSACRPTRSATPARTGACRSTAGTSSRATTSAGCVNARAGPAALRRLPHRSSRRLLPDVRPSAERRPGVLHARHREPSRSPSASGC